MAKSKSVEERLAAVELELAELKRRLPPAPDKKNWIDAICGSFKDDPEFDEILRLGREIRQSDRPKPEE
jgi:hypothetical protein